MFPNLSFGSVSISTYWLMLAVGTIGMFVCLMQRRKRFSLSWIQSALFTLVLTIVGIAGTKLLHVLENLEHTLKNGLTLGGFSFFGAVFLIPLVMPLAGKMFRLSSTQTMDISGPCVAIMIGCMRVGCFFQGCCGGWEANIGNVCFQWPTQAIESICDFIILAFLLRREGRNVNNACLYPWFMILYGVVRFFVEFLRDTPKNWLLFSQGQWYSAAAILVGVLWIIIQKRKGQSNALIQEKK
ncbi:MAG: prolipoprotein diacylglyceryl transferase [Clostridia bacterium]|nr:prolipoprotein diacylglyceryl transferase [Clostridia bacterium]